MSERTDHAREMIEAVDRLLCEIDGQVHQSGQCGCHDGVRLADAIEGVSSFEEVIEALRSTVTFLKKRNRQGWVLDGAVKDGQVNLVRPAADPY